MAKAVEFQDQVKKGNKPLTNETISLWKEKVAS